MNETRRTLLDALADGPVAGPALADRLGISRAAVWKQVDALREAGFEIEGTEAGYVVRDVPAYGGEAVAFGLDATYRIEYHEALASTNDRARALAGEGDADVVVLADAQTGGRGRRSREWRSPPGGVWLSILLRPDRPPAQAPLYTLAAAVAVTRAAREVGVDAGIKWPNDVLVRGDGGDGRAGPDAGTGGGEDAKLAGVLTEMEGEADRVSWLVVGIGVNANVDADDLPPGSTSLRAQAGDVDRRRFVQRLLETFHDLAADPDGIVPAWREHADTLGRRVRVETASGTVEGEAVDVTDVGALVVRRDGGPPGEREITVHSGDCEHLRPA